MIKPQLDPMNEAILGVGDYPERMKMLEEPLREKLDMVTMETIEDMILIAYKSGFLDGWKEALFYSDN